MDSPAIIECKECGVVYLSGEELCLCQVFDVPFVFWMCPNRDHRGVQWNEDCTDATCLVCGCKRSDGLIPENPKTL